MATTNYGWTQPANNGDTNNWGIDLNNTLQAIDSQVFTVQGVANAALPAAGGTLTGLLKAKTSTFAHQALGSLSGSPAAFDLSDAQSFAFSVSGALTPTLTNPPTGASGLLLTITNGGAFAISWPASFHFPGNTNPVLTASGTDILTFLSLDGGTTWHMVGIALNV